MSSNVTRLHEMGACPNPACKDIIKVRLVIETSPASDLTDDGVIVMHGQVVGAQTISHDCAPKTIRERREREDQRQTMRSN